MSCPNVPKTMSIFFSPRLPPMASMGNYGVFTTLTNATQNSKQQVDNVPSKSSSRPHPFQTQLGITWHAIIKQQAAKDI